MIVAGLFALGFWPSLIVVVIVAAGSFVMKSNRTKALKAFAPSVNFTFEGAASQAGGGPFAALAMFPVFNEGTGRAITNVLHGRVDDADVRLFDYAYTTSDFNSDSNFKRGSSNTVHAFTVAMFTSAGANVFPTLQMYPETFFSKLGAAFGGADINLPHFPEFSRRFVLQSPHEDAVRAMFDQPTAAFFETYYDVTVCTSGTTLVFYRPSKTVAVAEMRPFLDLGVFIYRTLGAAAARLRR